MSDDKKRGTARRHQKQGLPQRKVAGPLKPWNHDEFPMSKYRGDKSLKKVAFYSPDLKQFMLRNRALTTKAQANGWFDDLIDGLIDTAEEYGDMFYPGIRQGAGVARKLKERFIKPKSEKKAVTIEKEIKREIAKEASAVGVQTGPAPPRNRVYFHSKKVIAGESHVVGCELVKLLPAAAYSIGDVVYKVAINPTTLPCPKLKRTVRGYERVRVQSLSFHLDSACGSTKAGQLAILIDRDPKDPWESGGELVARAALSHSTCRKHNLYMSSSISVPASPLLWVDNDEDPDAVRFDTFGTYVIICTQAITNDVTLGVLSCSYDFVVEQPAENDNIVGGSFLQLAATGGHPSGTRGVLESMTVSAQSSIPYHVVSQSLGQLSIDAAGAFFVQLDLRTDAASTSSSYDNGNSTTAGCTSISFGTTATAYTGVYGNANPSVTSSAMICDRSPVTYSAVVYAESPWTLNILPKVGSICYFGSLGTTWLNAGQGGLLRLWVLGLDSLPFATLGAARRAKRAADAVERAKRMASLFQGVETASVHRESKDSKDEKQRSDLDPVPMIRERERGYTMVYPPPVSGSTSSSSSGVTSSTGSGWYRP